MANRLSQSAEKRKMKHVPAAGSDLWSLEGVPNKDIEALARTVGLLYMGLKDLKMWLHELEDFVNGGDIVTENKMMDEVRELRGKVKDLDDKLTEALKEVEILSE